MKAALVCCVLMGCAAGPVAGQMPEKMEPLPFPKAAGMVEGLSIEQIEAKVLDFNAKVGTYPPSFKGAEDRKATYEAWTKVVLAARLLQQEAGKSERIDCALASLYRQGHNMEVAGSGALAFEAVVAGLERYPKSVPVHQQAVYFYLQADPRFAPKGEAVLLRLRELLGTDKDPEVERGLFFAYLYQEKLELAKAQLDRYLEIRPEDAGMRQFQQAMREGKFEGKVILR